MTADDFDSLPQPEPPGKRKRRSRKDAPKIEGIDLDPLVEARREQAASSLAQALLDLDTEIAEGRSPSGDEIGNVTLRQVLQMLADPLTCEQSRMKCLELLTSLRTKKLVQKTAPSAGESHDLGVTMPS